jgi:hypothetical protein
MITGKLCAKNKKFVWASKRGEATGTGRTAASCRSWRRQIAKTLMTCGEQFATVTVVVCKSRMTQHAIWILKGDVLRAPATAGIILGVEKKIKTERTLIS